jgi:hypothetical protein
MRLTLPLRASDANWTDSSRSMQMALFGTVSSCPSDLFWSFANCLSHHECHAGLIRLLLMPFWATDVRLTGSGRLTLFRC